MARPRRAPARRHPRRPLRGITAFLALLAFATAFATTSAAPASAAHFPPGRILWSPAQDLETEVIGFVASAVRHVLVFAERIESDPILEALIRVRNLSPVPVRLVVPVDGMTAERFQRLADGRVEVKTAGASAGFSGVWIMVDGQRVLHTPGHLSYAQLRTDRNHTIILDHHLLCENYQNEFDEMFIGNSYGAGSPAGIAYPRIETGGAAVESFFAPENDPSARVGALVDLARKSLRLTCRAFGSAALAAKFRAKRGEGVAVSIVHDEAAAGAALTVQEELKRAGVDLWRKEYALDLARIREDFLVVDDRYVMLLPPTLPAGTALSRDGAHPVIDSTQTAAFFGERHDLLVGRILGGVNLRGQVTEAATGEPVHEARLTVLGTGIASFTDRFGLYSFKNLPTGEITLEIEKTGRYTIERRLVIPGGRVDFAMRGIEVAGALRGAVADTVTRRPLEGITLAARYIDPSTGVRTVVRTRSGAGGFFRFDKLPVGEAQVVAETTDWLPNEPAVATVRRDQTVDLVATILLRPRFVITAMPNPIYPSTILVHVKSYAPLGRVPDVTVTQKDWIPVAVAMGRLASDSREVELYAGAYRIAHGYFGTVRIEVNRGEAEGSFELGFLEAGSRYTFRAPGRAVFELVESGGASGQVAAFPVAVAHGRPELLPESADGVELTLPRGARLGPESVVRLPRPDAVAALGGALVYRRVGDEWIPAETADRDGELVARATGEGIYCALIDRTPPALAFDETGVVMTDAGSGVAPLSLALRRDGATVEAALVAVPGGYRAELPGGAAAAYEILVADRAGNVARRTGAPARAAAPQGSLTVVPNPVRASPLVAEVRLPAPGAARLTVHDAAGRKVADLSRDTAAALHRIEWDLRDRRGRVAANGTYLLTAYDGAGRRVARAKAALLR